MAYKLFMAKEDGQKLDTKLLLLCLENKLMTGASQCGADKKPRVFISKNIWRKLVRNLSLE